MTKVLIVPSAFHPSLGGVEEIAKNFGTTLQDHGYSVDIVVNRWPQDLPAVDSLFGLSVHRFHFHYPKRSLTEIFQLPTICRSAAQMYQFFSKVKPDIVHVICPSSAALYLVLMRRFFVFKTIVTFQGELFMDQDGIYDKSTLLRFGLNKLLGTTDSVTACSQYVLDDAKRRYDLNNIKCSVIFNGVNLSESGQHNDIDVNQGRPFIFALGRIVQNKGFDVLIDAFKRIAAEFKNIDLLIAGSGPNSEALQTEIDNASLNERIRLIGRKNREEVSNLFAQAQLFVMPSPVEPFGIVCLEAMRAGKAIVATNTGGPPEFIEEGVEGLLVPPNDADAMANALRHLLKNPELSMRMGQSTQQKVEKFSWTEITRQYESIYQEILTKDSTGTASQVASH